MKSRILLSTVNLYSSIHEITKLHIFYQYLYHHRTWILHMHFQEEAMPPRLHICRWGGAIILAPRQQYAQPAVIAHFTWRFIQYMGASPLPPSLGLSWFE